MEPDVLRGVFAPLARIAQLHERNVQLSKDIDDLHTQLLREIARQGVVLPSTPITYPEPKSRVQDLKRIIKYLNKKSPAWRIQILRRRTRLQYEEEPTDSDEEMEYEPESSAYETEIDEEIIPSEDQKVVKKVTHEIMHGGDIVDDVAAILYAEEKGVYDFPAFKADTARTYGITFDSAMEIVKSGPIELLTTFDILASVREYPAWRNRGARECKVAIERMAMNIIQTALVMPDTYRAALFGPDGVLESTYHRMQDMYLDRIIGIRK
ncbi:hypothetical protein MGYG_00141 [Nannizzia gypsea CBS 118893]|uniref:Uncharacterized protein n=1 Tax=Arthroderma gypseum (strain ATCC MYA-4604 / CBS 118893) TaxID=535722 RepID=E5R369_ARTGP|nr:hypothetical protein MGYG_00141 [Nannizzia gypsea CBS 118893]EFQ97098.1 hypothetical protein MGYG_00141 [Nannizzia gypsea CBS 118893]